MRCGSADSCLTLGSATASSGDSSTGEGLASSSWPQWALRESSGLVRQDDILHAQSTVRQTLEFAATMRLGGGGGGGGGSGALSAQSIREELVEDLLLMLGLAQCADVRIGAPDAQGEPTASRPLSAVRWLPATSDLCVCVVLFSRSSWSIGWTA